MLKIKILKNFSKLTKKIFICSSSSKSRSKYSDEIKNLPFDYYQIYDCDAEKIQYIKNTYNKKIIVALTIKNSEDIKNHELYKNVADIYLFDSKGYEKSLSFNHSLISNIKFNKEIMLAGNIQTYDNLKSYKRIADIIDISGGLETSGLKDISKIKIFLNKIKKINDEA